MEMTLLIIAAANAVIGWSIGICGIAGFLLPMLYTAALDYSVELALAASFLAFLVSGVIGSYNYYRAGNLEKNISFKLSAGSIAGAVAGVYLQALISQSVAKTILYLVVLLSGLSILYRLWRERKPSCAAGSELAHDGRLVNKTWFLLALGLSTGAVCSLSGAGGPILVMPLLVTLGVSPRLAVGIALLNSVFIAVPSCLGYLARVNAAELWQLLLLVCVSHGLGVLVGSRMASVVPINALKIFVAVFSVSIAIYMLA